MSLLFIYDMTMYKKGNKYYNYMFSSTLLEEYKKLDNNITICCNYEETETDLKLNFIDEKNFKRIKLIPFNFTNIFRYYKINNSAIEDKIKEFDKVIIRAPSFISFSAIKICEKYNKQYLVEMVGCPFDAYWNHSFLGKIIAIPFYFKTKKIISSSKNVVYVTQHFLQNRYPTKGNSFSCSDVELPKIKTHSKKLVANEKIKLCTIASLDVKYKGQIYVIKALAKLKNPNIQYHLIGQGEGNYIKKMIKKYSLEDNIVLVGSLSHDEVLNYLSNMDIYIQPSLQEGLPRTMMEAMSVGLPVCGSNVGGIPELVSENLVFKKKSVNSIIKKINFLLDSKNYSYESQRSLIVVQQYSSNKLKETRQTIYENVFKKREI